MGIADLVWFLPGIFTQLKERAANFFSLSVFSPEPTTQSPWSTVHRANCTLHPQNANLRSVMKLGGEACVPTGQCDRHPSSWPRPWVATCWLLQLWGNQACLHLHPRERPFWWSVSHPQNMHRIGTAFAEILGYADNQGNLANSDSSPCKFLLWSSQ